MIDQLVAALLLEDLLEQFLITMVISWDVHIYYVETIKGTAKITLDYLESGIESRKNAIVELQKASEIAIPHWRPCVQDGPIVLPLGHILGTASEKCLMII